VSDLPLSLPPDIASRLAKAFDRERKIERTLESLGPMTGRDILVVGGGPDEHARYGSVAATVTAIDRVPDGATWPASAASADTIVCAWSCFRGVDPAALAEADRILRPGGRLLVVHDYGRDDVSRLRGDLPEYGAWSRRTGPFLANGFRVRVIHCFWTFDSIDDARGFLMAAFDAAGTAFAVGLKRPRLSYNVAIYHRGRGGVALPDEADTAIAALEI
jgi:SAM-dependent methyltransferase